MSAICHTLQQIQLNSDEIALYDEMIADKEKELTEAQRLEDEQLERYRARVRAMEEKTAAWDIWRWCSRRAASAISSRRWTTSAR